MDRYAQCDPAISQRSSRECDTGRQLQRLGDDHHCRFQCDHRRFDHQKGGNPSHPYGYVGHYDGIIRNNFIFASRAELFTSEYGADGGIALAQACGAQALHNTVAFTRSPFAAIEWRFSNTDVDLINNLVSHKLMDRGGLDYQSGNLSNQPLSLFVDGPNGDLHLDSGAGVAIDQGVSVTSGLCDDDFDGQTPSI